MMPNEADSFTKRSGKDTVFVKPLSFQGDCVHTHISMLWEAAPTEGETEN